MGASKERLAAELGGARGATTADGYGCPVELQVGAMETATVRWDRDMVCKAPMAMSRNHADTGEATVPRMTYPRTKRGEKKPGESWVAWKKRNIAGLWEESKPAEKNEG